MPPYELLVIMRAAAATDLARIIKRTIKNVVDKGGIVGTMENLGTKRLPFVMHKHGERFEQGSYITLELDAPAKAVSDLLSELHRDTDIVRPNLLRKEVEADRPCAQGPCYWGDLSNDEHKKALKAGRFRKLN